MSEPYIGEIRYFPWDWPPEGWQRCDGSLLRIVDAQALFALIGTQYGGDGARTFAVPDLRGSVAVHQGEGPGLPKRTHGSRGGVNSATAQPAERTIGTLVLNPCICVEGIFPMREF